MRRAAHFAMLEPGRNPLVPKSVKHKARQDAQSPVLLGAIVLGRQARPRFLSSAAGSGALPRKAA